MASNPTTQTLNSCGLSPLIELYKENTAHGRHTETQRQLVTGILLVFVGGVLALLGTRSFDLYLLPIAMAIIPVGMFGKSMVEKLNERFDYHMKMAKAFRTEIETQCPYANIGKRRNEAKSEHKKDYPEYKDDPCCKSLLTKSLRDFWLRIYNGIIGVGVVASLIVLTKFVGLLLLSTAPWRTILLDILTGTPVPIK